MSPSREIDYIFKKKAVNQYISNSKAWFGYGEERGQGKWNKLDYINVNNNNNRTDVLIIVLLWKASTSNCAYFNYRIYETISNPCSQ